MSAHPLHGTKPLADKLQTKCDWGTRSSVYGYKLQRPAANPKANTYGLEVHPTARFTGQADLDDLGRVVPGQAAQEWAKGFPGWTLCFL
jgi:hypothetical protein